MDCVVCVCALEVVVAVTIAECLFARLFHMCRVQNDDDGCDGPTGRWLWEWWEGV
jgi:hypothetical protein